MAIINGTSGNDTLNGTSGADSILGAGGDDRITGGGGIDLLDGQQGSDLYMINTATEHGAAEFRDTGVDGTDEVRFAATTAQTLTLFAGDTGIERIVIGTGTGSSAVTTGVLAINIDARALVDGVAIIGNSGNNILQATGFDDDVSAGNGNDSLYGYAGDDRLEGGLGDDLIDGGLGSDTASFNSSGSAVNVSLAIAGAQNTGQGMDTLTAIENIAGSAFADTLAGNAGANVLDGGAGNDTLNGGSGNDFLIGGAGTDQLDGGDGSDVYVVSSADEHVLAEIADSGATGTDELRLTQADTAQTLTLSAGDNGIERIVIGTGTGATAVTTGFIDHTVDARALTSGVQIFGNYGANTIYGGAGNDYLDGGLGYDNLYGGAGDDTYEIYGSGVAHEEAGEGVDTLISWNGGILQDNYINIENLTLAGGAVDGTGNEGANILTGTDDWNRLTGLGGDDHIYANGGNDELRGGEGNDSLYGGTGDDSYWFVDAGDEIVELADEGNDTVYTTASYVLPDNFETLILSNYDLSGTGNALDNKIIGNIGNDVLNGMAGDDELIAVEGNDILIGGAGNDSLDGGAGLDASSYADASAGVTVSLAIAGSQDTVGCGFDTLTNIENLIGSGFNDTLTVNGGANVLTGGLGNDIFRGSAANLNGDTITDLAVGDSIIFTDAALAGFTFNLAGNILTYTGGSLTLQGSLGGQLVASAAAGGGVLLTLQAGDDIINGTEGDDIINGTAGDDTINGLGGNDTINGLGGNDTLNGGDGSDEIDGGDGNDTIDGGNGQDYIHGGAGDDVIHVGSSNNYLIPEFIWDGAGNDIVYGEGDQDIIRASAGNDYYDGGTGGFVQAFEGDYVNYMDALAGIVVDMRLASNQVRSSGNGDAANIGIDTLVNIEGISGTAFDDVMTAGATWINFIGGGGNDILIAGAGGGSMSGDDGNDVLTGGAGSDRLTGGSGNDVLNGGAEIDTARYIDATTGVHVSLTIAGAQDTLGAGIDTLTSIENLDGSDYDDLLVGNDAANVIDGGSGNDVLIGGGGNDQLYGYGGSSLFIGGDGNDSVFTDPDSSEIIEFHAGDDQDKVYYLDSTDQVKIYDYGAAQLVTQIGSDIVVVLSATDKITFRFADLASVQAALHFMSGTPGDDYFIAGPGADTISGGDGNDSIFGAGGADRLYGNAGNDTLDGGAGEDKLFGGTGDDIYVIDVSGDATVENAGEGTDLVRSSISHGLKANIENLTLIGGAITGTGNALGNVLTGNASVNRLYGLAGDDIFDGGGGGGEDKFYGGTGNDTYIVDSNGDATVELAGEGTDLVQSSVTHTLKANVENLILTGSLSSFGTGNALANIMTGNSGANRLIGKDGNDQLFGNAGVDRLYGDNGNDLLHGGSGDDKLYGGAGDDIYVVDSSGDATIELLNEGTDLVQSSVSHVLKANIENLELTGVSNVNGTGNGLANLLTGNSGDNLLSGLAGNDVLDGAAGRDTMTGGTGADGFLFDDGDFAGLTTATCDVIIDFSQAEGDTVRLDLVDANSGLAGDQAFAFIGGAAFSGSAGQLRYEQIDGNTYLQGDTNGDSIADFLIRLDGLHLLESSDFFL